MELDSQAIERRDFPIVRRGYDPASVDAHLRALAADVEELRREASSRGHESLAAVAGTQVQGILEAAQATAETIEREAAQAAQEVRDAANADAKRTREEAVTRAQEHVAAVSRAAEVLLARVGTMDAETQALVESLRGGTSQLAEDLVVVATNMGALYDAAAGRASGAGGGESPVEPGGTSSTADDASVVTPPVAPGDTSPRADDAPVVMPPAAPHEEPFVEPSSDTHEGMQGDPLAPVVHGANSAAHPNSTLGGLTPVSGLAPEQGQPVPRPGHPESAPVASSGDIDGARLVALNMALNGDSREETGRYLAENFDVPDREHLLDEVYAAIEG